MHYFAEYGLFLAKTITFVIAIIAVLITIVALSAKNKIKLKEKLEVKNLNEKYEEMKEASKLKEKKD